MEPCAWSWCSPASRSLPPNRCPSQAETMRHLPALALLLLLLGFGEYWTMQKAGPPPGRGAPSDLPGAPAKFPTPWTGL